MKTTLVTAAVLSTAAAAKSSLRAQESAQLSARTNMYMEVDTGLEATMTPQDMRAVKVQVGGCHHNCPPSVTVDVPAGEFLSCPGQVDKGNWHGKHPSRWWQYGDRFQPTVDGNSVKVTRKDTGNDSHGWGMNLSFDCFVGKSVLVNIGSNHGHNPGPKEASVPHLPAGFELDCPKTVSIQNWLGRDTYGDTFDIQIEDEAVMATRTDTNNPQSGWGMNLEFECAVKAVVTAAPNKWMATRTGRSYNLNGKRFGDWGAAAQNAEKAGANLQCCSLDGKTASRQVHGEGGPACNRDAAGTQHDGGMTWITAYNACKDGGMRLCTDAEVFSEVGGYTGCNFDNKRVWTSTPWSEVPEAARKGASTTGGLGCPSGYTQKGGLGADKGGCGLESCGARYGDQAKNENACRDHCEAHSECKSFSYAPENGDKNHQGKRVCTIYGSTDFNQMWQGKENGQLKYMQIACVKN